MPDPVDLFVDLYVARAELFCALKVELFEHQFRAALVSLDIVSIAFDGHQVGLRGAGISGITIHGVLCLSGDRHDLVPVAQIRRFAVLDGEISRLGVPVQQVKVPAEDDALPGGPVR